jgi:hypothetical protein
MRKAFFLSSLAGLALAALALHAATAQEGTGTVAGGVFTSGAVTFNTPAGVPSAPRAPYSATRKITRMQKLANGTTIAQVTTSKIARDSQGRTYNENRPLFSNSVDAPEREYVFVNVFDPVTRTTTNWNTQTRIANIMHMPDPSEIQRAPRPEADTQPAQQPAPRIRSARPRPQIEQLGTRNINGVDATGRRVTTVIPTGQIGNDQPLTTTRETWSSPELGLVVLSIEDDPRTGTSTTELIDIDRGEPDPALFQIPEGYTVHDRPVIQPNN